MNALRALVIATEALAIGCFVRAMWLYPGGTELDPHAAGHSFWLNYLCDLTGDLGRNGEPNQGALFARAAMLLLLVALGGVFVLAPRAFPARVHLSRLVRTSGLACVLTACSVPASAAIGVHAVHDIGVLVAGPLGLIAALGTLFGLTRAQQPGLLALSIVTIGAATVVLVIYAYELATGTASIALPIGQRCAFLLVLVWIAVLTWRSAPRSTTETNRSALGA